MLDRRKELKQAYKEDPRPMGVYQIRNTVNGKVLVGSGLNLPGNLNSNRFQLKMKVHRNQALQDDWNLHGAEAFAFEILETLDSEKTPREEWRKAVTALEEKWLNKLQPYEERGYNKPKTDKG